MMDRMIVGSKTCLGRRSDMQTGSAMREPCNGKGCGGSQRRKRTMEQGGPAIGHSRFSPIHESHFGLAIESYRRYRCFRSPYRHTVKSLYCHAAQIIIPAQMPHKAKLISRPSNPPCSSVSSRSAVSFSSTTARPLASSPSLPRSLTTTGLVVFAIRALGDLGLTSIWGRRRAVRDEQMASGMR